jgi:hypothetical protein
MLRRRRTSPEADVGVLRRPTADRVLPVAGYVLLSLACYLVLLAVLSAPVHGTLNPFAATRNMVSYAGGLKSPEGPVGIASYPWEWLLNQTPINYFTVNTDVSAGGKLIVSHPVVAFQGLMNPFVIFLALPALALSGWLAWHERDRVAALAVAWFVATFMPFLVMSVLLQRTEYLYYMVVIVPAVYLAVARLFSRRFLPRAALIGYAVALAYGFYALYPFRNLGPH